MRTGTWIAYTIWVGFFGILAYVVAMVIASSVFGISGFCVFSKTSDTADTYMESVGLAVVCIGLALVASGPALATRSGKRLAMVPLACYAAFVVASAVAAGVIGDQPCVHDDWLLLP